MSTIYDSWLGFAVIMIMAMAGLREYVKDSEGGPFTGETPIDPDDVRRWRGEPEVTEVGPQAPQNGGPRLPVINWVSDDDDLRRRLPM